MKKSFRAHFGIIFKHDMILFHREKNGQEDLQRMKEYCWKKTLSGLCFSENSNSTMTYQNHGCKKGENSSRGKKIAQMTLACIEKKSRSVGGTTAVCTFDVKVSV